VLVFVGFQAGVEVEEHFFFDLAVGFDDGVGVDFQGAVEEERGALLEAGADFSGGVPGELEGEGGGWFGGDGGDGDGVVEGAFGADEEVGEQDHPAGLGLAFGEVDDDLDDVSGLIGSGGGCDGNLDLFREGGVADGFEPGLGDAFFFDEAFEGAEGLDGGLGAGLGFFGERLGEFSAFDGAGAAGAGFFEGRLFEGFGHSVEARFGEWVVR